MLVNEKLQTYKKLLQSLEEKYPSKYDKVSFLYREANKLEKLEDKNDKRAFLVTHEGRQAFVYKNILKGGIKWNN